MQGMEAALTKKDSIIQSYRDHCTYVARGGTVAAALCKITDSLPT